MWLRSADWIGKTGKILHLKFILGLSDERFKVIIFKLANYCYSLCSVP